MEAKLQELVIISGKGGTGKTSVAASFAVLAAGRAVIADCDVDAADLHLVLAPRIIESTDFKSGHEAVILREKCTGCGLCAELCRFGAVKLLPDNRYRVDPVACEGCGVCVRFCPAGAIAFPERLCGEWLVSETRCGPMVHACLGVAAENSGKLVSLVRREALRIAGEKGLPLIVTDGPPGIGCPVIASVTGASQVLVVTEPTVSGEHDLARVLSLTRHFGVPVAVCVNKWDINPDMTERIERKAEASGARVVGRIRYDRRVTAAQIQAKAVVETDAPSAADIRNVWANLKLETGKGEHMSNTTKIKIAIPLAEGKLCMHFGHCETFALVDVDLVQRKMLGRKDLVPPPHEPGVLPRWLAEQGAEQILAGGMGQRAQGLFAEQNIKVTVGLPAETPEMLIGHYLAGTLQAGQNVCDH